MRRRLAALPARMLQYLALLIAFALLIASSEFCSAHPVLSAILVLAFSMAYLVASVAAKKAEFLYGTMLFGAVSYFLACHALGAPETTFPLLSVPLVAILWVVARLLTKRLPAGQEAYPRTVLRAMHITVAVFATWALIESPGLMAGGGWLAGIAGLAYLGFAAVYMAHSLSGAPVLMGYVFTFFLVLGGAFTTAAFASLEFCWIPVVAAAAIALLVGTELHPSRGHAWSRHFYFAATGALVVALGLSVLRWRFILLDMALSSLLLWTGYLRLARAITDIRRATMAERAMAKYFLLSAAAITLPVAAMIIVLPGDLAVAAAAVLCGATFSWMSWQQRRQVFGSERRHILAAAMFGSGGLLALVWHLPEALATPVAICSPAVLLAALAVLYGRASGPENRTAQHSMATAAVFPALLAWLVPLLAGQWMVALAAAGVALVAVIILAAAMKEKRWADAIGPALAGVTVAAVLIDFGQGAAAWAACAVAAVVAAAFSVAGDLGDRGVLRGAAHLAWLILSVAVIVIAVTAGLTHVLYAATAVGAVAILMAGRRSTRDKPDLFDNATWALSTLTTAAAVVAGPLSEAGPTTAGLCVLVLAGASWIAFSLGRSVGWSRAGSSLFALGALLVIFGRVADVEPRLAAGAGVVVVLLTLAATLGRRWPATGRSAAVVAHVTTIVLAATALAQAWAGNSWLLVGLAVGYAVIYAAMPVLRRNTGLRLGAILWVNAALLLGLAAWTGGAYRDHILPVASVAVLWVVAGRLLERRQVALWSQTMYYAAALVSAFCGLTSLFGGSNGGAWEVFLANGVVFASLFAVMRLEILAYMVTLTLSLMAYDWVKASTSPFTQDVLFYLVIGLAALGPVFLLPALKRLVSRAGRVPMISVFTWRGAVLFSIPVAGLGLVLMSAYSVELTGHPKFCTMCHYMGDYYGSWQHSSHQNVACIQCHYEPGVTAEFKGKVAGLVQVVKYVSHSYGTKPHALISNESCMRGECHAGMDHDKHTLLFEGQITFNHAKHLAEQPRGKVLNCVSCHGQTVEGQHLSVTETTCLTCHFYGRGDSPTAAAECRTCHQVPEKTVTFMGQDFQHRKFFGERKDIRCEHCHNLVTQGAGGVSPTRCQTCHLEVPEKIQVADQAHFHLVHVSKGQFDCLQCHDEIKHGVRPMKQDLLAAGNCRTCHGGERHSLQERIYAGTAVPSLDVAPDAMFKAGVACSGCHTEMQTVGPGETSFTMRLSGAKQCADCHGSKMYGRMLEAWQEETKSQVETIRAAVEALDAQCREADVQPDEMTKARELVDSARSKVTTVVGDGSNGAHNINYVTAILESAGADVAACRKRIAAWKTASAEVQKP